MSKKKEITKKQIANHVKLSKTVPIVSSVFIAKVFNKTHNNVIRDIENMKISLLKIEQSERKYFRETSYINSRGKLYKRYDLMRKGFDLLVLSFTGKEALRYKIWFIDEFHKKTNIIHEQQMIAAKHESSDMWMELREETKVARTALTDAIKDFELPQRVLEGKDSSIFVSRRIVNYTQMIYKRLGISIPSGVDPRRILPPRKLLELEDAEYKVADRIKTLVGLENVHYKQAYQTIKAELKL